MGYQYAEEQNNSPARKAAITRNWRKLEEVNAGDRLVAYLPGNRYYATGMVRAPRRPRTTQDRTDTIEAYLERGKSYQSGFVYFPPSVVYENFTDESDNYPVRVDVESWDNYVPEGVSVKGLNLPRHKTVNALFEITKGLFYRIAKRLVGRGGTDRDGRNAGRVKVTEDDAVVEAIEKSYARSQGFLLDSRLRKALEGHAMEAAKRHFEAEGYRWEDHSKSRPYDLRCGRGREVLYVEVKGTQTDGSEIILTPGEVGFARAHNGQIALFVLDSIIVGEEDGGFVLSGGEPRLLQPRDVDAGKLMPVSFKYGVPGRE